MVDLKKLNVVEVDYTNAHHAHGLVLMMDAYACDIMGGGKGLSREVKANLAGTLANIEQAFSVLIYDGSAPVALANCFYGFSTFKCQRLVNIHDFVVLEAYRGKGLSQVLLKKIEDTAVRNKCCKITLEVLEGNHAAQSAYSRFGFAGYELNPSSGKALFWEKDI